MELWRPPTSHLEIAPAARVFDLCHEDPRAGAYLLGSSWAHLPKDALVVVDPGVGSPRRAVANRGRLPMGRSRTSGAAVTSRSRSAMGQPPWSLGSLEASGSWSEAR